MLNCENCDKMHWGCCVKPMLGGLLWLGAVAAVVAAWMTSSNPTSLVLGRDEIHWYLDAIVLAVLALGCKIHCGKGDCGKCGGGKKCQQTTNVVFDLPQTPSELADPEGVLVLVLI